jgi:hypothetical protein
MELDHTHTHKKGRGVVDFAGTSENDKLLLATNEEAAARYPD